MNKRIYQIFQQQNLHWLSFFRIGIALICLLNFLVLQIDFEALFSTKAYAPANIAYFLSDTSAWSLYKIHIAISKYINVSYDDLLLILRILYPTALLSLLLGFHTRIAAAITLLLFIVFSKTYSSFMYGFDAYLHFSLFYCLIFPTGSYNAITTIKKQSRPYDIYFLRLLQIHLSIAYFFSGFEKLLGFNWRNGESLWKALHGYSYNTGIDLNFLANTPFFFIAGWATIVVEILYPVFMNIKKTRNVWMWSVVVLHLSIALLMGLYFFSGIMIVLNLSAYYFSYQQSTTKADTSIAST